jgi:hypothetical protein
VAGSLSADSAFHELCSTIGGVQGSFEVVAFEVFLGEAAGPYRLVAEGCVLDRLFQRPGRFLDLAASEHDFALGGAHLGVAVPRWRQTAGRYDYERGLTVCRRWALKRATW